MLGATAFGMKADCLAEGTVWQYDYSSEVELDNGEKIYNVTFTRIFESKGDTIVGGETYHKIYTRGFEHITPTPIYQPRYLSYLYTLIREDNGKIYFIENHGDTEGKLLYDFNLKEGEEVEAWDFQYLDSTTPSMSWIRKCLKTDVIESCGISYLAILTAIYYAPSEEYVNEEYWIEGIGKSRGAMFGENFLYGGYVAPKTIYTLEKGLIYNTMDLSKWEDDLGVDPVVDQHDGAAAYAVDGIRVTEDSRGIRIKRGKKIMH